MSSIRPLATITVLAVLGIILYMKINETEVPLPEGVEDWSANTDIQFDMGGDPATTEPQFAAATPGDEAPAFSSAPPAGESAPALDPNAAAAPAWTPPPADSAPTASAAETSGFDANQGENITTSSLPNLPPLPSLPPTAATEDVTAETAQGAAQATEDSSVQTEDGSSAKTQAALSPGNSYSPGIAEQANPVTPAQASLFSATRLAVEAALDRGELSQALLLLSDWYGDPSLSPDETKEVNTLLSQLAGSVIYSTEHRLEPPYMVQTGERLEAIAKEYNVPWQLLAKINGITSADQLQPGQQLKVVRGPFSALIDLSQRKLTLMLDRRYAGHFSLSIEPSVTVEAGHWEVNQKLLTPANVSLPGASPSAPTEERSLMLSSINSDASQVTILRGTASSSPLTSPTGRELQLKPDDAEDIYDILSLGSKVVIRR